MQRVSRHDERLEPSFEHLEFILQAGDLGARFFGEFRVIDVKEPAGIRELLSGLAASLCQLLHLLQSPVFATKFGQLASVGDRGRVGKRALHISGARQRFPQAVLKECQALVPYFWRKRSTRPAVSISFCLPVKNGWQAAQMSRWIWSLVERVWNVLPHAHLTVAVAYTGWISVFIKAPCMALERSNESYQNWGAGGRAPLTLW